MAKRDLLRTYYCTGFRGHYPVGTSAVIHATNAEEARTLLEIELQAAGLKQEIPLDRIVSLSRSQPSCVILTNGDY